MFDRLAEMVWAMLRGIFGIRPGSTAGSSTILLADGTAAAPALSFASDTDIGIYRIGSNNIGIAPNGSLGIQITSSGVTIAQGGLLLGSGADAILQREAAAIFQMGADVNGAAVNQTFKAHDGITGTDIAGATFTLAGGRGTGAGTGGTFLIATPTTLSTGTTAQTLVTRITVSRGAVTTDLATVTVNASQSNIVGVATGGALSLKHASTTTGGLKTMVAEVTVSPSAIETAVFSVPAGSVVRLVQGNVQSALTGGGTTATWSLGTAGDPDKYGTAGYPTAADSLAKNSKSSWTATPTHLAAAEPIVLTGAATGGASDGDTALTVGSVRVVIVYDTYESLENAA